MESRCNTAFDGFLEFGSRFTLRLNTTKSTKLKNALDKSSLKLNFLQKKTVDAYLYLSK